MKCPYCGSEHVQFATSTSSRGFSISNSCCGAILLGPLGLLCGACGMGSSTKDFWVCLDCGNKFSTREGRNYIENEQKQKIAYEQYKRELFTLLPNEGGIESVRQNLEKAKSSYPEAEYRLKEALYALTDSADNKIRRKSKFVKGHYISAFSGFILMIDIIVFVGFLIGHTFLLPSFLLIFALIALIVAGICIDMQLEAQLEVASPETIQGGYLADFTDITVNELFHKSFGDEYDNLIWGFDDGKQITLTIFASNLESDMITVNFKMLDDQCFKITSIESSEDHIENTTDMLAILNNLLYRVSLIEHLDKEQTLLEHLDSISCSDIQYGASADYTEDRTQIAKSFGELPTISLTAYELLESCELIEASSTEIPEASFLGNWNSDISKLEITSRGEKGKYNVTLTVYPWPARYATWAYEAEYDAKTGNLDCRNGIRIDHGKAAADKTIVYDGDGAAEILVSDGGSLSFVSTSACPEDDGVLPSPIIFRTDGSTATPEPPASLGLSQYYGFYNSKDVGLFWVTLDRGSDDDSFYVYIEYESMMKKGDVHADVKPDGETYMTFSANGMTGSDGIVRDMGSIEGAVSLEILNDGTLHMILYTSKSPDDVPFDVILEPGTRF